MIDLISEKSTKIIIWFERILAFIVLCAVTISAAGLIIEYSGMDLFSIESLDVIIHRTLLLVIGLELARMLVVHDLITVLELLAFIIARKLLKPEIVSLDIILGVVAFTLLIWARRFLVIPPSKKEDNSPL